MIILTNKAIRIWMGIVADFAINIFTYWGADPAFTSDESVLQDILLSLYWFPNKNFKV